MSDSIGTCEYVLDPDNPETWGGEEGDRCYVDEEIINEDGVWTCPHHAEDGEDLCIFHLPLTAKDSQDVVEAFSAVLNEAAESDDPEVQDRNLQFLNTTFGKFELSQNVLDVALTDERLTMAYTKIAGEMCCSNIKFNIPTISFRCVEFCGDTDFAHAEFCGDADFSHAEFDDDASFRFAKFGDDVNFSLVNFEHNADFWYAKFDGEANFWHTKFNSDASFQAREFSGDASFKFARFNFDVSFKGRRFCEDAHFNEAEFGGDTNFSQVTFDGDTDFVRAEFNREVDFSYLNLDGSRFDSVNLTNSRFVKTDLRGASLESTILSRANLHGADLRGAKIAGAVLGDIRIDGDTQFLGHPDDDNDSSPHTLSAILARPCCVYDPKYENDNDEASIDKAKSVYRALEELAGRAAQTRLQSQCFVRRQDLQKDGYKQVMLGKGDRRGSNKADAEKQEEDGRIERENHSLEERLISGVRYSRAKVARVTLLYGESPWRIIGVSSLFVIMIGFLYPTFGWIQPRKEGANPITWTRILDGEWSLLFESIYFSALTFTTLGMGDYEPLGGGGQALATLNTAFGAILIALLVFVFGRRAAR